MQGMHSELVESLVVLWTVGIICCGVGIFFLYKAFAGGNREKVFPTWLGRTLSVVLGLTGVGLGLDIIVRILKH
jgi:hypothetical protein